MRGRRRRGAFAGVASTLASALALALSLGTGAGVPVPDSGPDAGSPAQQAPAGPDYRFLSSPDFMNADIADLSVLPRYTAATPNSWNRSWGRAVDVVMDAFAGESPEDVLVAGDLVNGHWGRDVRRSGVFGPVGTPRQQRAAVSRAAATYYPAWRRLFDRRGLPVHVAVGDHEIGDNDWSGSRQSDFKQRNIALFKREFARHALRPARYGSRPSGPASRTAYATRLAPEVQLVTVDVFERTRGDVVPRLDRRQLAWLDRVLARANRDGVEWIIVQGHTPVLGPVRTTSSSALMYRGGSRSGFWRTMARHDVDLYLSGEVHDITARQLDGVTQISHGGIFSHPSRQGKGGTNYLLGEVSGDTMRLTSKRFTVRTAEGTRRLWQTTDQGRPPLTKTFDPLPRTVGTMTLGSDGRILARDGLLGSYRP